MGKVLAILFCIISFHAFPQARDEARVAVDSNLTISLNNPPKDTAINGLRMLHYSKDHIYYQIIVNDTIPLKVPTENRFRIVLAGIRDGMTNRPEYKIYSFLDTDTLIGGVPGKFIHFYNPSTDVKMKEMFYFITLQNGHSYIITTAIDKAVDENIRKDVQHFFTMAHFKGIPYDSFQLSQANAYAPRKPFVPLDYEYPAAILSSAKTFVYKNLSTSKLAFKEIGRRDTGRAVIINWKDYDASPIADSCTEINDRNVGHYMIINGNYFRGIVDQDTTYQNGSRLGEKIESESFTIGGSMVVTASIRSRFLKDTITNWKGKMLPTLVIQSDAKLVIQDPRSERSQQSLSETFYYFAKDVGLVRYSTTNEQGVANWVLTEIKDRGK